MNFDLNIHHYTRNELVEMFGLPTRFDRSMVEAKEAQLRESILRNKDPAVQKAVQVQTLQFLARAKQLLLEEGQELNSYSSSYQLQPTHVDHRDVQTRPDKSFLSSYPGEFFQGVINPLKKRTIRKNLNIDTRFRENYYNSASTNFNLNLPATFNDVVQMQLASLELPNAFHVISKQYGNNYFTLTLHYHDAPSQTLLVTIPSGNYTPHTLMDAINAQLTATPVTFLVNLKDAQTGSAQTVVGFIEDSPSVASIELNFQADRTGHDDKGTPLPLKLGWVLGFRNGVYAGNLNYVSEGVVDVNGAKYLFLVVDDYTNSVNNGFYSAFSSSILNNNILARISLQSSLNQNNLNLVTTPREYFGPVNINNLTIQLLDEYGRIVDLNNSDFSFCLTLVTAYDL